MLSSGSSRRSITVNGRFLSQSITGVQRYAYELLTALDHLLRAGAVELIPVTVLVPPNAKNIPEWSCLRIRQVGRFTGQLWEQIDLPIHARNTLLFTPCGGAPLLHQSQVITIHDAGPFSTPRAYALPYRTYYKVLQRILARSARHVITVSEFSKRELMRFLHLPEHKISFTWLSGEHILRCGRDDSVLAKYQLVPGSYVLGVGSRNPNKNLQGLVEASSYLDSNTRLAIVGGSNSAIFRGSDRFAHSVTELGSVSDAELRSLYEHAACFVFPSFYEGFGLPPLEALTLGCAVIVSRAASLPEIFQEAAHYCDPHRPEDIAKQIVRVLEGEHPAREDALGHSSSFKWERCARETWSILERALD